MSDKKFQRFGKYLILDHLVDGGMAKICRARYLGEHAKKMVAIKMIQPQHSSDETFVRMFQDELNITFDMVHPNIMQVYDYGKVSGQLYTAMEYIHGANLKQYLDRLKENKKVFPVEASCFITSQACLGLHYAHTFKDKLTGKPYNVVHRDISPHNIMLTFDGAVKVIDFGIAKANTNSENTQAGTIKGKLSYLAPEYLDGLVLDARYDEFALGITLWEMLCSRKLFQANNDLATLKQIQACRIIPPSQINPLVPKELDEIVLKALSKDRTQRFDNLDQMNRALVRFLYSSYPNFNPSDLKEFAHDLFRNEIIQDEEKFVEYGNIDIKPYIEDFKNEENRTDKSKKSENGSSQAVSPSISSREKIRELEMDIQPIQVEIGNDILGGSKSDNTSARKLTKTSIQGRQSQKNSNINPNQGVGKNKPKEKSSTSLSVNDKNENTQNKSNFFLISFIGAASVFFIFYLNGDLTKVLFGVDLNELIHGQTPDPAPVKIQAKVPEPKRNVTSIPEDPIKGTIMLGQMDTEMILSINGNKIDFYGKPIEVELDKEIKIVIIKTGFRPFETSFVLTKENSYKEVMVQMEEGKKGILTTSGKYTPNSKLVYEEAGVIVERDLPLKDVEVNVGTYQARIINTIIGTETKKEFKIEESKKTILE